MVKKSIYAKTSWLDVRKRNYSIDMSEDPFEARKRIKTGSKKNTWLLGFTVRLVQIVNK